VRRWLERLGSTRREQRREGGAQGLCGAAATIESKLVLEVVKATVYHVGTGGEGREGKGRTQEGIGGG